MCRLHMSKQNFGGDWEIRIKQLTLSQWTKTPRNSLSTMPVIIIVNSTPMHWVPMPVHGLP